MLALAHTNPNPPNQFKPVVTRVFNSPNAKHYLAVRPSGESYFALVAGGKR